MQSKVLYLLLFFSFQVVPYGLAVRIPGFYPDGLNSTQEYAEVSIFDLHQALKL